MGSPRKIKVHNNKHLWEVSASKTELDPTDVIKELEKSADDQIVVAFYLNLLRTGQTSTTRALVSMVQTLSEYAKVLEERQDFLFSDAAGEA